MKMDQLHERLLNKPRMTKQTNSTEQPNTHNRMTLVQMKSNNTEDDSFIEQDKPFDRKQYFSIIEEPTLDWKTEQILLRSMILEDEEDEESKNQSSHQHLTQKTSIATSKSYKNKFTKTETYQKKKSLNLLIFNMQKGPQKVLYYFNIIFNAAFRIGLVVLLVGLFTVGDSDGDKREERIFITVLVGLQGIISLLYFLAITKMLYTKSCTISVEFQKQFYQKPYSEIHMQRILRKHFNLKKIISNLSRLANPFTPFNNQIRISVMKQQIYKRMQLIIVFVPLAVVFIMGTPWFDKSKKASQNFDIQLLMAIVVCTELVRCTFHYLFIYIFS